MLAWDAGFNAAVGWIFFISALLLLWRIMHWPISPLLILGFSGFVVICTITILIRLRSRPSYDAVAALMDARLSGGGLIMADHESWSVNDQQSLRPSWKGRQPLLFLIVALSLFVLAAKAPLTGQHALSALPLEIESMEEEMQEQVDLLAEIDFIEEEQARDWSQLIRSLRQESNGRDPAATWEALDELSDRIQDATAVELDTRRMEVQKREELIAALKTALQAYEENRTQADEAMQELSDLLNQAAKNNPHLKELLESLPQFGMQQVVGRCLTKEEAQLLAERMSQMTQDDLERMQKLLQNGMCQSDSCQRPGGEEALKKFLAENPGCTNLMVCAGIQPGSGWGTSRGPGTAPISWLGETSEEHVDFEEQVLSASKLDSLAHSEMVGESYSAPEVDLNASGSAGGVLNGTSAGDSAATTHTVLPRHRDAVNRYFKRNEGN